MCADKVMERIDYSLLEVNGRCDVREDKGVVGEMILLEIVK
ncbi:hypothetical protein [Anaerosporobacter sp.]